MSDDSLICEIAVLKERLASTAEAIKKQAIEYERRLQELNHAHQQQMDRNAQYVSREAWEIYNGKMDDWRREVDRWRWISIGAGCAGGGGVALLLKALGG